MVGAGIGVLSSCVLPAVAAVDRTRVDELQVVLDYLESKQGR